MYIMMLKFLYTETHDEWTAVIGVRPLLPDPEASNNNPLQQKCGPSDANLYQQQQRQQIHAYHQQRQQMQQQQQQQQHLSQQQQQLPRSSSAFPSHSASFRNGGRNFPNQNPEMNRTSPPMPGQQNFQQNMNGPQGMQNVNLAAQALVQQQLIMQAARARFSAQTQLLNQQPQQVR